MKIYLASSSEARWLISSLEELLRIQLPKVCGIDDFEFVSGWYRKASGDSRREIGREDFEAVDRADLVIGIYPYGEGTASEIAYAAAAGKRVIFMCHWEDADDAPLVTGTFKLYHAQEFEAYHQPNTRKVEPTWFVSTNDNIEPLLRLCKYFKAFDDRPALALVGSPIRPASTEGVFRIGQRVLVSGNRSGLVMGLENQRIRVRFDGPGGIEELVNPIHMRHEHEVEPDVAS